MFSNKSNLLPAIMSLLLVFLVNSVALANEGNLTIPSQVDDFVALKTNPKNIVSTQPSELLQVFVGGHGDCCAKKTPMAGRYIQEEDTIKFLPTFNFVEGQEYVIQVQTVDKNGKHIPVLTPFTLARTSVLSTPEITAIYPSGDFLPENVLRFYLHFSTPMKPNVAFNYIKLVDEDGHVDDAAFMKFKQELWSADRTRLTLLMDPGRIKRGVATNVELGPALHEGKKYRLIVEGGWPTANGHSELQRFSKAFKVSRPLRELPDIAQWKISRPTIGSHEALTINFDRPFDHQLLSKDIKVRTHSGEAILGSFSSKDSEMTWVFIPDSPWTDQQINLVVDGKFEDVAGNNFRDLMDHAVNVQTKDVSYLSIPVTLRR